MASTTEHYRQYLRDMLRIYHFYDQGKFDSEEADALRDAMETPWYSLSETEQTRIRGLALDLNHIRDPKRIIEGIVERGREGLIAAESLQEQGNLDEALASLRENHNGIPPRAASLLRARIWSEFDVSEVAAEFQRDAGQLLVPSPDSQRAKKSAIPVVAALDDRFVGSVE